MVEESWIWSFQLLSIRAIIRNDDHHKLDYKGSAPPSQSQSPYSCSWDCNDMEFFKKLMIAIGVSSSSSMKVDFIAELPVEIAQHLLRMLDTASLINASCVSRRWLSICKSDNRLRQSVKHHLRDKKREMIQLTDTSRKSRKTHKNVYANKERTSRLTHRRNIVPTNYVYSNTSKTIQMTCQNDSSKKLKNTLIKAQKTRSADTLPRTYRV